MDVQGDGGPAAQRGAGAPAGRPPRPRVVVLDVNETLADLSTMGRRFTDVGAPSHLAATWFAALLRDGFALAAAGTSAPFADVGAGVLRVQLADLTLDRTVTAAVEHIMDGFSSLRLHPDVGPGTAALTDLGLRLVTLTNGSTSVSAGLFDRAGIRDRFEQLLSVEDAGVWKPARGAYAYALDRCGVAASDALLVAVHPWDVDGAARAGMRTAWINRAGSPYPGHFRRPDLEVETLTQLAPLLA